MENIFFAKALCLREQMGEKADTDLYKSFFKAHCIAAPPPIEWPNIPTLELLNL